MTKSLDNKTINLVSVKKYRELVKKYKTNQAYYAAPINLTENTTHLVCLLVNNKLYFPNIPREELQNGKTET